MKVYDRICVNEIDDIIKKSNGDDIKYIRDGDRSADDLDVISDTPTSKVRWVLIYIHFQIYSKAYKTNESL